MDVDGVEFDIQLTGDGQLVVLHDDTLERTAVPYSRAKASLPEHIQEVGNVRMCLRHACNAHVVAAFALVLRVFIRMHPWRSVHRLTSCAHRRSISTF